MRSHEYLLLEGREASLWHGIKLEHAETILSSNQIGGRTTQRYWLDGRRRKEGEADYQSSFWLKGISTTRDPQFAVNWGSVILELDQERIAHNFKIIPYAWNFHIDNVIKTDSKREREEFIVLSFTGRTSDDYMKEWEEYRDRLQNDPDTTGWDEREYKDWLAMWTRPEGRPLAPLDRFLKGVYLNDGSVQIYGEENSTIQYVMAHPKFKGLMKATAVYKNDPESQAERKELRDRINSSI